MSHQHCASNARTHTAFTLIELLVVVSIIGLLVSILLPSLAHARLLARSTVCKSNLKQLGLGMTLYREEEGNYPAHQWYVGDAADTRIRWFNAMADIVAGYKVQGCPQVSNWEVGRNNSYGYNYKYIGSTRDNNIGPTAPFERFPVRSVENPTETIAFGDSDGTGWKKAHVNGVNDPDMIGNHGYTLDPTYIPDFSLQTYSGGVQESYAWKDYRTYISTRHPGDSSNLCFLDNHVESMPPEKVYIDNRYWNGLGREDPDRDRHVSYKFRDGGWRFPDIPL